MLSENKLIYSGEACRMVYNSKEDNPYAGTMAETVWKLAHDSCLSCIEACAAVDAVEVVHGRWIDIGDDDNSAWQCSNCKHTLFVWGERGTHCRFCGAKMDLEENK